MQPYRLFHIPRLAHVLIRRLLDHRACVETGAECHSLAGKDVLIDQATWFRGRVEIRGCNMAGLVYCKSQGAQRHAIPEGRFQLSIPRIPGNSHLWILAFEEGGTDVARLSSPGPWREFLTRILAFLPTVWDTLAETPAILTLMRSGDPAISAEIQRRLGITKEKTAHFLPPDMFGSCQSDATHANTGHHPASLQWF